MYADTLMLVQMKRLTNQDVLTRLKKMQNGRSIRQFAKEIGVGPSFLSDVYLGNRGVGKKILAYLGLVQDPPTYSETNHEQRKFPVRQR